MQCSTSFQGEVSLRSGVCLLRQHYRGERRQASVATLIWCDAYCEMCDAVGVENPGFSLVGGAWGLKLYS